MVQRSAMARRILPAGKLTVHACTVRHGADRSISMDVGGRCQGRNGPEAWLWRARPKPDRPSLGQLKSRPSSLRVEILETSTGAVMAPDGGREVAPRDCRSALAASEPCCHWNRNAAITFSMTAGISERSLRSSSASVQVMAVMRRHLVHLAALGDEVRCRGNRLVTVIFTDRLRRSAPCIPDPCATM